MYQKLADVTLKDGEQVEAGVIQGPDADWADRLEKLLWHKGDPWNWQNAQVLERNLGLDAFFYVLHRAGEPLANIMTIESQGIGLFGHVWTVPAERQKGASSALMALQMQHFGARGGQALFLGTGYDSVAYHMYRRFGFQSVEPQSGYMAYYGKSQPAFEEYYFAPPTAPADVGIHPLTWSHWPLSAALFLGDFPGVVRSLRMQIFGRQSSEGGMIGLLLENEERQQQAQPATTVILQNRITSAVVGLATYTWHPVWPDTYLVDIYCHPAYAAHASALLDALSLPRDQRVVAYVDADHADKIAVLAQAGFQPITHLPDWVIADKATQQRVDVVMMVRGR